MTDGNKAAPEVLQLIVGALYFHLTTDPRLSRFFTHVPVNRIIDHQRAFLDLALNGRPGYSGRSLSEAHAELIEHHGLTEHHFDLVLEHLEKVMSALDIETGLAKHIYRKVEDTKPLIFGAREPVLS